MKHYFQAEQLKYRHTSVAAITFGMPVFTALLAFWLTSSYFSIDVYNWWYIGLYPGFLGILCSIIGKKDKQKKNYTIWSLPCGMEQIWDAKILVGIKMSAVSFAHPQSASPLHLQLPRQIPIHTEGPRLFLLRSVPHARKHLP